MTISDLELLIMDYFIKLVEVLVIGIIIPLVYIATLLTIQVIDKE